MPQQAEKHVAGVAVLVSGAEISPRHRDLLLEVRVRDTLALPDSATIRIADPKGEEVDDLLTTFAIGKAVEIKVSAPKEEAKVSIFRGDVVSVEPDFGKEMAEVVIRALDKGHKLQRQRKVRTFQQVSAADMANRIAQENGLVGRVESTSPIHEFFQQSAETDWDFLKRLARDHGYRVVVAGNDLHFGQDMSAGGTPVTLTWQDNLMSFRPRLSAIQQVDTVDARGWDPKNKQAVTGVARNGRSSSQPGIERAKVASDGGGGTTLIRDRVFATSSEATEVSQSALDARADAFVEAEGLAFGNPEIKAGNHVSIQGVGQKLGGTYLVSASTHVYKGATGYKTSFQISGHSARTLLDLMHPPERHDWTQHLVVGLVTNNNDPEQMGRVRVKYPSLSDTEESAWARVASVSAGNARGLMMLPQPNEEVILGFEHGDARRPIVVGSLFNGRDKPGTDLLQNRDGSFALLSNEKAHIHTKKDFEIKSDQNMVVEITKDEKSNVGGNTEHTTTGNAKHKAQQFTVEAGSTLSVKGVSVTVEASASLTLKGATVDVQASGPLNLKGAIINLG